MSDKSFPNFLKDLAAFKDRVNEELSEKTTTQKGEAFNNLITKVLPLCEEWGEYGMPKSRNKKSHDSGIDFVFNGGEEGSMAVGQSKMRIPSVETLDSILSKFQQFESKRSTNPSGQIPIPTVSTSDKEIDYYIVTMSQLSKIKKKYEASSFSSRDFYEILKSEGRIHIIDGNRIYNELKSYYDKTFNIPKELEMETKEDHIKSGEVYLSIVSSGEVKRLFRHHGTSLFFENIRDFMGMEKDVNNEIMHTLDNEPDMMLSRNNGLTFKAEKVEEVDKNRIKLKNAGIVNGCQTTMCIVNSDVGDKSAEVPVKIVTSGKSWDVAKSANYQNKVHQINLDLAQYLRPQLIQKVATDVGYSVKESQEESVTSVLNEIHQKEFMYEEVSDLFLGIFSNSPQNLFGGNRYSGKLRTSALDRLSKNNKHEHVLEALLRLVECTREASKRIRNDVEDDDHMSTFSRFFDPDKVGYRSYFSIITCCSHVGTDISKINADENPDEIYNFIDDLYVTVVSETNHFVQKYVRSVKDISKYLLIDSEVDSEDKIQQRLSSKIQNEIDFSTLFQVVSID